MLEKDPAVVQQVLDDFTTAPIDDGLKATLAFLKRLTLTPADITSEDIEPMRAVGVSERAIEEAIYVCFLFNFMDRLADAFDFEIQSQNTTRRVARILQRIGYKIASVPG